MKRVITLVLVLVTIWGMSGVSYASISGDLDEIELLIDPDSVSEENIYRSERPDGSPNEATGTNEVNEMPEELRGILNGEDHASKLFATDQFSPTEVDTGWLKPLIDFVSWAASAACGVFCSLTLLKLLIDTLCLVIPGMGRFLFRMNLSWMYSDTCAMLMGLPRMGGQGMMNNRSMMYGNMGMGNMGMGNMGNMGMGNMGMNRMYGNTGMTGMNGMNSMYGNTGMNNMNMLPLPQTTSGKVAYLFKESFVTAIIAGAILVAIATGVVPTMINIGVNAVVNFVIWMNGKVAGL